MLLENSGSGSDVLPKLAQSPRLLALDKRLLNLPIERLKNEGRLQMRGIMLISCACLGLRIEFGNISPNTSQTLRHDLGTVLVDLRATPMYVVTGYWNAERCSGL
jgi:hypothetical protein